MKRTSLLLSLSILLHLSIINLTYYLMTPEIILNFIAVICYNIVWVIIALIIGRQIYSEEKR